MTRWRARLRRVFKWVCTSLVAFAALGLVVSIRWQAGIEITGGYSAVVIGGGAVFGVDETPPVPDTSVCFTMDELGDSWSSFGVLPNLPSVDMDSGTYITIPLWMPLLAFGVPAVWMWHRDRRRPRAGCCKQCGYDLTGNVSGTCPECGASGIGVTPGSDL